MTSVEQSVVTRVLRKETTNHLHARKNEILRALRNDPGLPYWVAFRERSALSWDTQPPLPAAPITLDGGLALHLIQEELTRRERLFSDRERASRLSRATPQRIADYITRELDRLRRLIEEIPQ